MEQQGKQKVWSTQPISMDGQPQPEVEAQPARVWSTSQIQQRTEEEWLADPEVAQLGKVLSPRLSIVDANKGSSDYMKSAQEAMQDAVLSGKGLQIPSIEEFQEGMAEGNANATYSDLEYSQGLMEKLGSLNWNMTDLGLTAMGISDWEEEEQVALIRSLEIYDSMPTEWKHVARAGKNVAADPTSWVGIGAIVNALGKLPMKAGATSALNRLVNKTTAGITVTAGIEGAGWSAADNVFRQAVDNKGDFSQTDLVETGKAAGMGLTAGTGLGYFLARLTGKGSMTLKDDTSIKIEPEHLVNEADQVGTHTLDTPEGKATNDVIKEVEGELLTETGVVKREASDDFEDYVDIDDPDTYRFEDNPHQETWNHMYEGNRTFNTDRIETLDDAEAFLESFSSHWEAKRAPFADGNPDGVETLEHAREKINEEAQNLLDETGMDIFKILEQYKDDHAELQKIRYRAQGLRELNVSLGEQLLDMAIKADVGDLTDKEQAKFIETAGLFSQVMEMTKLASREFSRGLGNYRLIMRGDDQLMQGIQSGKMKGDVKDLAKTILGMTKAGKIKAESLRKMTPKQRGEILKTMKQHTESSRFKKMMDGIIRFRSSMMLSGPSTIEAAALSNFAKMWTEPLVEWVGSIGFGSAKKLERTRALAQYAGTRRFMGQAWANAREALRTGQHITDPFTTKMEDMKDQNIQEMSWVRRNLWERGVHAPHMALMFLDELVKSARSRALVYADTVVEMAEESVKRSDGTDLVVHEGDPHIFQGDEFEARLRKNLSSKFDLKTGRLRDKEILREVRESTFTNELEGTVGKVFNLVANAGGGAGRLIAVPFIRAPMNIVSEGLMYLPIPVAWTARQRNIMKTGSVVAQKKLKARKMLGAAAFGGVFMAAEEELITGSGPSDYKQNKLWRESGYEPYSIKVGDEWVRYSKLGPIGMFMGIVADINWISKMDTHGTNAGDALIEYGGAVQHALVANVLNKAYFSSLNQLMDGIQDPDKNVDFWQNWIASFTPNVLAQMNGDDNVREATSFMEKIQRRLPVISEKLGKQYDFYGQPITKPAHDIPIYGYMFKNRQIVKDPVADEVYRLSQKLDRAILNKAPYSLGVSQTDFRDLYDGNESESVYAKYNRYIGEARDGQGRDLHQALAEVVNSATYRNMSESDFTDITPPKAIYIQKVVNSFRERAKQKLHRESEAYRNELQGRHERKASIF